MKCEIWIEELEESEEITLWMEGSDRSNIGEKAVLHGAFEAEDYNSAMQKYYDIMGWGEYKPF